MQPHCAEVFRGCYDVPGLTLSAGARVLDIGANVGAFAVWAAARWPGCEIHCYEPHPENAKLLRQNARAIPNCTTYELAVTDTPGVATLWDGANNCGEASLHRGYEQTDQSRPVDTVRPGALPDCDVLKVDTEGCEVEILKGRPTSSRAIMLEWHHPGDRWEIGGLLTARGYTCVRDDVRRKDRGIMCWTRETP